MILTLDNQGLGGTSTANLDRGALITLPKIANNLVFSDVENWSSVSFFYLSVLSNQTLTLNFTGKLSSEELSFVISSEAKSAAYALVSINIKDKANGVLRINRSEITDVGNYDLISP
jgi:hypothetical protein